MKFYIDESGNTGDLVQHKTDLTFSGQPIFTLAALGCPDDCLNDLKKFTDDLKLKYKINSRELKLKNIFAKKPELILELLTYIQEKRFHYFIEIVSKKYFICNSISRHQICTPHFIPDEQERSGEDQIWREVYADCLARDLSYKEYDIFFNSCRSVSKKSLFDSFDALERFALRQVKEKHHAFLKNIYKSMLGDIRLAQEDFFRFKYLMRIEKNKDNKLQFIKNRGVISKFVPIPNFNKREQKIYLLPHISSLTNILARVNFTFESLDSIYFVHDNQVHFDDILGNNINDMVEQSQGVYDFNISDFQFKCKPLISFGQDSAENIGIQVADILAGFAMKYVGSILSGGSMRDIHHIIFKKMHSGYGKYTHINFMLEISGLLEILGKDYGRTMKISEDAKYLESLYKEFLIAKNPTLIKT